MGRGVAMSACRAGLPTIVWDRHEERASELAASGAEVAPATAAAVSQAGIVITMVPDVDAVMSLAVDNGVLEALAVDAISAQMSTIGVAGIRRVEALVYERRPDVHWVDAPVSGSKGPAEHGQLTIFASGRPGVRARVTPLFDALGQHAVWVGPVGALACLVGEWQGAVDGGRGNDDLTVITTVLGDTGASA